MVSAPRNSIELARLYTAIVVRVGDEDGNAPTETDETIYVNLLSLEHGTGGRDLDRATFAVDLGAQNLRIVDSQTEKEMNRQVEVYAISESGDNVPLFWGEFSQQDLRVVDGEQVVITAAIQKQHFGSPIRGPEEYDKSDDSNTVVDKDIIFNPDIRGRIYGNQRTDPNNTTHYVFVDPDSAWTSTAETYIGATPAMWDVKTAVKALCRLANSAETLIDNPGSYDILDSAPALKNFRIKRGTYLTDALDMILEPHGYSWYVKLSIDSSGDLTRTITIIEQGNGAEKQVYFQRPGEVLDNKKSNAPEITVKTSLTELANKVTVYGDFIRKEATLELKKGWAAAQDALTPDELQKKDESGSQYETYPNAHRKWIFNEGGDYNDLRTETGSAPADLTVFGAGEYYVHKRRKIAPKLLTLNEKTDYRDPYLEYYDNSLSAWKPVPPEWGYEILEDEIGVYFDGNTPPSELWAQGTDDIDNMRLRLTCVIACDARIEYTAVRQDSSPNSRNIELYIDASDRFFNKQVDSGSTFFGVYDALEEDDSTAIQTYAENLRDINDSANIEAAIVLFGIINSYQRGDLLTKVEGRNISFNRNSTYAATKKYLQITKVLFDYQNQRTVLETRAYQ